MAIMGVPDDKPMASKHDGSLASSVATQVRESLSKGVIWVGTEDGNLQVRQDGGERFTNVATISSVRPKAIHTRGRRRAGTRTVWSWLTSKSQAPGAGRDGQR
jgi:hypothetical protein